MKIEQTEILVIGAGPAGLIAAREAARKGTTVTVWEEDSEIGRPCHCAGLLSLKGLQSIGVPLHESFVENRVRGARFFSPSGLSFTVEREEAVACVVNRRPFDNFLARQATEAGARIKLNSRVLGLERVETGIVACGEKETAGAKIIIDAEGISSKIVKDFGLKPLDQTCLLPGLQFDLKGVNVDRDYVEIHTGKNVAPRFFAWVIPLDEKSARVGLACKEATPKYLLERFVKNRFGEGNGRLERVATRSGRIVTCGPIQKTFDNNILVVGDVAGQVKPTTGGGVIFGGICASIAGEVAAESIKHDDSSTGFLRRYEDLWKKRLDKEFHTTLLARRAMNNLSDRTIDKLFKIVIDESLQDLFSVGADMDFQSRVLLRLLKRKEVLRILPSFLKTLSPFRKGLV